MLKITFFNVKERYSWIQIHTNSQPGLVWATHSASNFHVNQFSCFYLFLLAIHPNNQHVKIGQNRSEIIITVTVLLLQVFQLFPVVVTTC